MFPKYAGLPEEDPLIIYKSTSDPDTMYMHESIKDPDDIESCKEMNKECEDQLENVNFTITRRS